MLFRSIAIIMDGNGRWAQKIDRKRTYGHKKGVSSVKDCISGAINLGIKNLTLYVFSTENWNRPALEINALMNLLVSSLKKETDSLIKNDIKLTAIGDLDSLTNGTREKLNEVINRTLENKKLKIKNTSRV